jgi:plastocyanin
VNPAIVVPAGTHASIQIVNADPDMAHGMVITTQGVGSSWMPMMTSAPAFTGAAVWALGNPTAAGMHTATLSFTAATPGTYQYLCPVPGHAAKGMVGTFIVSS